MVVALMDLWHYRSIVPGVTELLDFSKWLMEEKDYDVEGIRSNLTEDELEGAKILFILSPGYDFEKDEIEAVKNFILNGGSVLVSRPVTRVEVINPLLNEFGARFTGEEADSWAFFADIPEELLKIAEYRKLKEILSNHPINRGLKAVAEGTPKEKKKPFLLKLESSEWNTIGAASIEGKPKPAAAIRKFGNGKIALIGAVHIFYKWKFWYENRELEQKEDSYLSNYSFMNRLIGYLER